MGYKMDRPTTSISKTKKIMLKARLSFEDACAGAPCSTLNVIRYSMGLTKIS
jgi:hypothetical protein